METNNYDIINLQETHLKDDKIKSFDSSFEGKILHNPSDTNHGRGVATIFKKNFPAEIVSNYKIGQGRLLLTNIAKFDKEFALVNLYAPTEYKYKKQFFEEAISFIRRNKTQAASIIVVGDFNISAESKQKQDIEILNNFKNQLNLVDKFQPKNPLDKGYTFYNSRFKSRIDYIFIEKNICHINPCLKVRIAPVPDHRALEISVNVPIPERGPSYWKLNTQVLSEANYIEQITNIFNNTITKYNNVLNKGEIWDLFKIKVREYSVKYCSKRKKETEDEIKKLEEEILNLDNSPNSFKEISRLQIELNQKIMEKSVGAQLRSRAVFIEQGEKNTKFFLNLEKSRQQNNLILELKSNNGTLLNTKKDVLKEMETFYTNLYSSQITGNTDNNDFFNEEFKKKKLTESQKELCEGEIREAEAKIVLNHMKEKKSPGIDGLPIEFYKTFWDLIGTFLMSVYNESYRLSELPYSMNRSVISLLYKKGEKNDIKNYRPISLTNTDYKILTHIITNRLHIVLNSIINIEQTAYVKKRYIGENIRLIEDLVNIGIEKEIDGLITFLDFEKAFDSIEWNFVEQTLIELNFGKTITSWFKTIYKNPITQIKNNGWFTNNIFPKRGLKQGCPLSAILFIIAIEPLCEKLRTNKKVEGINLQKLCNGKNEKIVKTMQYADDIVLTLKNEEALKESLYILEKFKQQAGLKINYNKSEIIPLGKFKNEIHLQNIKTSSNVRYLGINIGYDNETVIQENWSKKLIKLSNLLELWKKRKLSMFGKIVVLKTLAISKLIFSAQNTTKLNVCMGGIRWAI